MSRYLLAAVAVALTTHSLPAAPIQPNAAKPAGFPFTARTPLVVCLNGYDKARERLNKLANVALPNEAPRLTKLVDEQLEKVLEGRKLTAIKKDERIYVVLNDLANLIGGDEPPVAVLVPVTSFKDFKESFLTKDELKSLDEGRDGVNAIRTAAFGEEMPAYLVDLKGYVAITLDKSVADAYAGKRTTATAEQMGSELAEVFLRADVAVYVNMDAVNDQFGDQIRGIKGLVDFGLQQAAQQGSIPGLSEKQLDALKAILKGMFQGIEDCRSIVLGAEFRPDGLAVQLKARFAEDSVSGKLLSMERPTPLAEVSKLPSGLGLYGGVKFGKTISDTLRTLGQDLATTANDGPGTRLIEAHRKDLQAAAHQCDYSASIAPGVSVTVSEYKDADKAARALTKMYKAIAAGGRANSVLLKAAPRVVDDQETLRDIKFTSVHLKYDFEGTVAEMPDQVREATLKSLRRTVDEETTTWIGARGNLVYQVMAKDWKSAKDLIDAYLDGKRTVGADANFKLTRSQLAAEANYLVIAETSSALTTLLEQARATAEPRQIIS